MDTGLEKPKKHVGWPPRGLSRRCTISTHLGKVRAISRSTPGGEDIPLIQFRLNQSLIFFPRKPRAHLSKSITGNSRRKEHSIWRNAFFVNVTEPLNKKLGIPSVLDRKNIGNQ